MIRRTARLLAAGVAWILLGACGSSDGGDEPVPELLSTGLRP